MTTDAPLNTFDRCFDHEDNIAFSDKLAYLPAALWAASSFLEARGGKVGARQGGSAGEGVDMMAHHYINMFLTCASYLANKQVHAAAALVITAPLSICTQCYGVAFLALHAIVEPVHDWSVPVLTLCSRFQPAESSRILTCTASLNAASAPLYPAFA